MTELLRVPPEARLDAVRRQLAWIRQGRVVLDLPEGWQGLNNAARMRLLQRQAQVQQTQVAIVTSDQATRSAAQIVGVPVFANAESALDREWAMEFALPPLDLRNPGSTLPEPPAWRREDVRRRAAMPTQYLARSRRIEVERKANRKAAPWVTYAGYAALAAMMLLLLGTFGLYILPAATITVRPGTEQISVMTALVANPDIDASNVEAGQMQGHLIETIIEEVGTAATSGSLQKPTIKATGQVIFSNLGTAAVRVPLGTVVSSGTGTSASFRTVSEAEIPGGVGQRVTVPIEALEPGIEGNVRPNAITNIDGPLRFRARVSSPNGTSGGGSELVGAVTQEDKDKLLAETVARAEARAVDALQSKLKAGEWLPAESVQTFVVAQAFDQYNDDEADQLNLTLRLLAQGVAVNEEEARGILQLAVEDALPDDAKLVADSLTAQRVPGAEAVGRGVAFTMTVNADYLIPVDPVEVRSVAAGLTQDDASRVLQERWMLSAPPEFYQDPDWLGTLPALPSRIQVRVVVDEPTAQP